MHSISCQSFEYSKIENMEIIIEKKNGVTINTFFRNTGCLVPRQINVYSFTFYNYEDTLNELLRN